MGEAPKTFINCATCGKKTSNKKYCSRDCRYNNGNIYVDAVTTDVTYGTDTVVIDLKDVQMSDGYDLGKDVTHIDMPKKGRTIAIVGFAETSRMQVLSEPEDTEIWSLNRCYTFLKRWDRWYEVHEPELYTGKTGLREEGYVDLLKQSTVPIYMLHPSDEFPMAQKFPLNEIINEFRDYFTTSIAYMLAHAAYEHKVEGKKIDAVHIYGVDMSAFSEYSEQLPCVNFWLGVLEGLLGKGKVIIPDVSPLLKTGMSYGRHSERPLQKMAKERLQHHKQKQSQITADASALVGASSEYQYIFESLDKLKKAIDEGVATPIELIDQLKGHLKERRNEINGYHAQLNAELNATLGGLREAQHFIVALNAPQSRDEEPEAAKTPNIGG